MPILLEMPAEIERRLRTDEPNLDAEMKEAVALDLFRKEKISIYELRLMLGLTRSEVNKLLVDRQEWAQSPTLEDFENDYQTLAKIMAAHGR